MKIQRRNMLIWAVVVVESGIPTELKFFRDEKSAQEYGSNVRDKINPEDDEVCIFKERMTG